ncbi:MAG: hypothetical protein AAGA96_01935 [Verrucomicrobiota bacterium]
MLTSPLRKIRGKQGAAFTLFELLAVIVIISILIVLVVPNFNQGSGTSTSLAVVEGLFSEARTRAIGEGTRTRIVIHNDRGDTEYPGRYLRLFAIAAERRNEEGRGTGEWIANDSVGELLAPGVFFDHQSSREASSRIASSNSTSPDDNSITGFGTWEEGEIDFPGPPDSEQSCYFYEFNSSGICIHDGSMTPGGVVVLSGGNASMEGEPILNKDDKAGFVILRNGGTSIYRNVKALQD